MENRDILARADRADFAPQIDRAFVDFDFSRLIMTLFRGWWKIIGVVLIVGLVTLITIKRYVTPSFNALATVTIEQQNQQVTDLESVVSGFSADTPSLNTEIFVIRSRTLVGRVVADLDLLSDPEFNEALADPNAFSVGKLIRTVAGLPAPVPLTTEEQRNAVIDAVLAKLIVRNPSQSFVFEIIAQSDSPTKAALLANTVARFYAEDQLLVKEAGAQQAVTYLMDRATQLQVDLGQAELDVSNFTATTELVSPEALIAKNLQLKSLRERVSTITTAQASASALNERLAGLAAVNATEESVAAIGDTALSSLFVRLKAGTLTPADFDAGVKSMVLRNDAFVAEQIQQAETLQRSITLIEQEVETQSQDLLTLKQLEREARATEELYGYFLTRLKEAEVQQGTQQADARLLSEAVVPRQASKPRSVLLSAAAALAAGLAVAAALLFKEYHDRNIKTGEQLEQELGVRVVGQVPLAPVSRRDKIIDYIAKNSSSPFLESIRNLRTSIVMSNPKNPPQVILLTSSMPGEGKTTIALTLARNFATLGKKTLLVEADLRRRTLSEYFEAGDSSSLGKIILSKGSVTEQAHFSKELGIHVILGEKMEGNAADFLSGEGFRLFVERARSEFDHIIFDTPPVLLVPDARVMGRHVDAVLYVVKWDGVVRAQVRAGISAFLSVGIPVTGTILSKIDPKKARRQSYGEYQPYGQYGSGYYDSK